MVRFSVSRISSLSTHVRLASLNVHGWGTRAHVLRGVSRSGVRVFVVTRPLGRVLCGVGARVRVRGGRGFCTPSAVRGSARMRGRAPADCVRLRRSVVEQSGSSLGS